MKTQSKITLILLLGFFVFSIELKAQSYGYKGMYVYNIDTILNDASGKTEDILFRYCRDSSFNAITLSVGILNLSSTNTGYSTKLAAFMKKARTRYGVKYFAAVVSDYPTLLNEVHAYQASRTDSLEKFNYYNYEFEYWNDANYLTGKTYCAKYLQPENCNCDSVGAWNYFSKYMKKTDSLAAVDNIKSTVYIGVSSKDTLKNRFVANTVDLVMIACYNADTSKLYMANTGAKFTAYAKANHKVDVIPIFASLTKSVSENLKQWLTGPAPTGKHSEAFAMPIFMREYAGLPSSVKSKINIIGYKWFKYGGMPKDSSFTAITITPSGVTAIPASTTATLNWSAITGANQYTVWYAPANSYTWVKINSNNNSTTLSGLTPDKAYQFFVFAKTSNGNTASSPLVLFSTLASSATCTKPIGMTVSGLTNSSATLSWTAVQGAASYNVNYRSIGQIAWTTQNTLTATKVLTNLLAATNYEFQVQTVCSASSSSDFTISTNFSTLAIPCGIPSALASSSVTTSSASLSWAAVSGAVSYNVAYRLGSSTTWQNLNTTATAISINALVAGSSYEFQVQCACTGNVLSSFSPISTFTTTNPICAVPTGIVASSITSSGATISWSVAQNSSSYLVQYRVKGTSIWTSLSNTGISANLTNLLPISIYELAVQSVCSATNSSAFSATTEFITLNNCNPPTGITSLVNSSNSATINWQTAANALSYKVDYKLSTASTWTTLSSTSLSQILSALTAASSYNYRLQSVCSSTVSAYSTSAQFTTNAATASCGVPSNLGVNSIASTSAKLTWSAVSGASSYKVQYRALGTSLWTNKTTSNSYKIISSLKAGTTYEFQIATVCSASSSSNFSPISSFITAGSTTKSAGNTFALRTAQGISIKWDAIENASEAYYLIEKSEDGIEFEPFKTVNVQTANFNNSSYEVTDNESNLQNTQTSIWYKLSVIDNEGNIAYLRTIEVLPKTEFADEFKIYPNPNPGDQINLEVKLEKQEEMLVVLIDILGNLVYSKVIITDDNGAIAMAINPTQELAKGIYQVIGYSSKKTLSQKLIVK